MRLIKEEERMLINNDKMQENHKCEDCRNNTICKYCGDMKHNQEEVAKIPTVKGLTPIKINITCRNFERKSLKQDEIYYR
jgi:hypothetical protein